jgi:hypothetical protein
MYHITEVSHDGQPCAPKNQGHVCVTVWDHCNVPINYREWKGKVDNPHVILDSVKNLLWDEILKHFTLPEGLNQPM